MRSALIGALVLITVACARPVSTQNQVLPTPTPSPSPTPTAPLAATSAPFHAGEVGVDYGTVAFSATGGVQPYTWSVSAGSMPYGLGLTKDGSLSGTPTSAGTFVFTIQVADAGGSTATISSKIGVAAALSASLIPSCAKQCDVELGCVNACGAFGQLSGGVGPYSYALTSGQVPAGTSLSGLSLAGTFTGLSGYLQFSVQVSDSLGVTATISPVFWMHQHISFGGGIITCFYSGCSTTLPFQGGIGTPTVRVTSWVPTCDYPPCGPPPAPSVVVSGGRVSIAVPGSSGGSGYKAVLKLMLTDTSLCAVGSYCSAAGTIDVTVQSG